jgi:GT2 family glycosyltransferase
MSAPLVSIVIPVFNRVELTQQCLDAIESTVSLPYEVIVVDNASTDGTAAFLGEAESAGRLRAILNDENLGFGKACNKGIAASRGRYVVLLNNDTIPLAGWLDALVSAVEADPTIGMAGSRLLYPNGTIQHAGITWNAHNMLYHVHRGVPNDAPEVLVPRDYPAVTGACILLPRDLLVELGGFDESFHMYVEDIDLCMRVWERGRRVTYRPDSVLFHLENASVTDTAWRDAHVIEGQRRLCERWVGRWPVAVRRLVWPQAPPGGPRHFSVLALAEELVDDVSLLVAFGRAFGSEEGTIVIAVPQSAPELGDRLAATASAAGI